MQWLFEGSEEAPDCPGLGLLVRHVLPPERIGHQSSRTSAGTAWPSSVEDIGTMARPLPPAWPTGSQVYFTHSYVAPVTGDTVAVTEHGEPFASIVQRGHIAGVQFHPEKSGEVGLQILRNFAAACNLNLDTDFPPCLRGEFRAV